MAKKKEISWDDAIVMLKDKVEKLPFGDILYEAAHEAFMRVVDRIEKKYDIIGEDGTKYNSETDEECWFDQDREEGIEFIMQKIQDFGREED